MTELTCMHDLEDFQGSGNKDVMAVLFIVMVGSREARHLRGDALHARGLDTKFACVGRCRP